MIHFSPSRVAILVIVALAGCSKNEKTTFCQPSNQTIVDGGSATTHTYTFEGGKLRRTVTSTASDSFETVYQYEADGDLAKSIVTANGQSMTTSYSHDNQHYLVANLFTHNGDTVRTTYTYNDLGQLIRQVKTLQDAGSTIVETYYYDYPDLVTHNPSSIATVNLTDSTVVAYVYDDKINPERELFLPTIQTYNNITRVTAPTYSYTIAYQYDELGYPVSSTTSNGLTRTWTYACSEF